MATISSHVLDSVSGDHAGGIRVQCYLINSSTDRRQLFDVPASAEGRISEEVDLSEAVADTPAVELVFHAEGYFEGYSEGYSEGGELPGSGFQVMPQIVVRLTLPDKTARYHIPIMLSPHSYSIWWSGTG